MQGREKAVRARAGDGVARGAPGAHQRPGRSLVRRGAGGERSVAREMMKCVAWDIKRSRAGFAALERVLLFVRRSHLKLIS